MKRLLLSLVALLLLLEEWLWDALTVCGRVLTEWLHLRRLQDWLQQASPVVALLAFFIPLLLVMPIGLLSWVLLAHGMILQGVLLQIFAKLLGTLLISQVFQWTKPQLMTFGVLALVYETVTRWLHWAHDKVRQTWIYQAAQQWKRLAVQQLQKLKAWLVR